MELRITSPALDEPWEGTLEQLLETDPELPELVRRRIETLEVGETIRPSFLSTFDVTRTDSSKPEETTMK